MAELVSKEILEFLGADPNKITTIDEFKKTFESEFIRRSLVKEDKELAGQIVGARLGSIETAIKKVAKANGLEFDPTEIKDKKAEDIIEMGFNKLAKANLDAITKLENEAKKGTDEKYVALEGQFNKVKGDYDQLKGLHETTVNEFNVMKENSAKQMKELKVNTFVDKHLKEVDKKLQVGIKPIEKTGYLATIKEKYIFDINEDGTDVVPLDKAGKKIPSTKVTGAFKTAPEILEEEAAAAGLLSQVPPKKENGQYVPPGKGKEEQGGGGQEKVTYPLHNRAKV